jgi:MoaA/NifB/PqqE/SkfB family radical SAM enzyme
LTRDCNLACVHCCTDSAPGRALPAELTTEEALELARQIGDLKVPYVILCGGEPMVRVDFFVIAGAVAGGGALIKLETNAHFIDDVRADRLSRLPIRSVQVSLDGATAQTYARMRPLGILTRALDGARRIRARGLPLEITFAPTGINIAETGEVVDLAASLGAFRFNTGKLMRVGKAARRWDALSATKSQYDAFFETLRKKRREYDGVMEILWEPEDIVEEASRLMEDPPATLLVLPDGRVKACGPLPFICADLRRQSLREAWERYLEVWTDERLRAGVYRLREKPELTAEANRWTEDLLWWTSDETESIAVVRG